MAGYLVRNADFVITVDRDRRIFRDGAVAIENGRISAVGKTAEVAARFPALDVIDGRGKIVLPGLFDTHIHGLQQLGRGLADNRYHERLTTHLWKFESVMTAEDALCAFRLSQLEMLRAGITAFADAGNYFPAQQAQAVKESGMRAIIARTALDSHQTAPGEPPARFKESAGAALAASEEVVTEFDGTVEGRLKAWFSMRMAFGCSDDLLREMSRRAEKHSVGIIGHACTSAFTTAASHARYGMGDIARLESLGVLSPNMLLLHVGWVDADELLLIRKRDVKVSLAPSSSFHHAMGNIARGRAPEMLALEVAVSLGSDSAMSSNFLDVIRQTYLLVGGYGEARLDPKVISPERAVEMMTINGARSMLWDGDTGSLEVGKKADVTILDVMRPEWQPVHNPIANLVYCAHGACADTVIVDGHLLMRGGTVLTLDADALYREAQERAPAIVKRAGLEASAAPRWPVH